ncbi:MAG: HEAT repeat domain-containing protein [Ignavibacteriales bacterium]|nr:HEAT repeat domain-containing protein [Ignavibacteriales bacterium]
MKALLKSILVVALLTLCNFVYADDPLTVDPNGDFSKFTKEQLETIENNLLAGLESENSGLRISCAYFLGEIKSEKALIPLMAMLRNGACDEEKIVAALSLYKLDIGRGVYLVKGASKFADSERVRRMCGIFYDAYVWEQRHPNTDQVAMDTEQEYNGYVIEDFLVEQN